MYDFDKMTDRKGTSCSKWDNMSSMFTEKGLLPLWIADMDFRCCEEAIEAMRQRVDHGIFGYTVLKYNLFLIIMLYVITLICFKEVKYTSAKAP